MMGVRAWWRHLTTLSGQTMRVWWAVLPKALFFLVAGWLAYQLALTLTAPIQDTHPWLSIIIFSFGLVAQLAGIIISIRLAGEPAGIWDKLPASAAKIGRDESLIKVLSLTLLPFVGVYSVFGGIERSTYSLFVHGARESSVLLSPQTATTLLDPTTAQQRLTIGVILIACYLLRRGLEATADRTGRSVFGLLGALVEGFFSVVLVFSGTRMLGDLGEWIRHRVAYGWYTDLVDQILDWLASLHLAIPAALIQFFDFLGGTVWPLLSDSVMEPLLWLAVAGMVFGTYTLSVAELWERGREVGISGRLARVSKRIEALERRGMAASQGSRQVTLEFFDVFVGDLEDRIVPFVQSLRHVLRVGVPFLGAYVLLYAIAQSIRDLVYFGFQQLIGAQSFSIWFRIQQPIQLLGTVLGEPIRIGLLAVAMTWTLAVNRQTEAEAVAVETRAPGAIRVDAPAGRGRRMLARLPITVVTIASLLAAGGLIHFTKAGIGEEVRQVGLGEAGELAAGQWVRVTGLAAGKQVVVDGEPQLGLVTSGIFLGVDIAVEGRDTQTTSFDCELYVPKPGRGWTRVSSAIEGTVNAPALGFTSRVRMIFERPADGLVGAQLRCKPFVFYLSYDPVLMIDLGIDEALQADLVRSQLDLPARVIEVTR